MIAAQRSAVTKTSTSVTTTGALRAPASLLACQSSTRSASPRSTRAADATVSIARPHSAAIVDGSPAAWNRVAISHAHRPIGSPSATTQLGERASSTTEVGQRHGVEVTSATAPP
jgi:hypothetical protein